MSDDAVDAPDVVPEGDPPPRGPAVTRSTLFDDEGRMTAHLPCLACGYDLFGATHGAECTECGTQVAKSIDAELGTADPDWLLRLLVGAWAVVPLALIVVVFPLLRHPALASTPRRLDPGLANEIWQAIAYITVFFAGWLYLFSDATAAKRGESSQLVERGRQIARPALALTVVVTGFAVFHAVAPGLMLVGGVLIGVVQAILGAAALLVVFAIAVRSRQVMRRLPRAYLPPPVRIAVAGVGVLVVIGFLVLVLPIASNALYANGIRILGNAVFQRGQQMYAWVVWPWAVLAFIWFAVRWVNYIRQCRRAHQLAVHHASLAAAASKGEAT